MSAVRAATPDAQGGRAWLRLAGRVAVASVKDFFQDNGPEWGAAIAYYSLLSIFPLLLAAAAIAAFFVDPKWAVDQATRLLASFVPQGEAEIGQIVNDAIDARGSVSILSIGALLWSGSRVFGAITKALNIAFDVEDRYGFFQRTLVELAMVATIGVLFVVALASRFVVALMANFLKVFPTGRDVFIPILLEAVPGVLLLLAFFLVYRFVPTRSPDWPAALVGAVLATAVFLLARPLFLGYVDTFANYNLIYGSLAIVIVGVIWAWVSSMILLLGGEVVSHIQRLWLDAKAERRLGSGRSESAQSEGEHNGNSTGPDTAQSTADVLPPTHRRPENASPSPARRALTLAALLAGPLLLWRWFQRRRRAS